MLEAAQIRSRLLEQHERLRAQLATCQTLARDGRDRDLADALARLRIEFARHNEAETAAIRSLLRGPATWSAQMIDRMLEEHGGEHTAFTDLMAAPDASERIDEISELLDAHMAAEERTFLSPVTLSDDVLRARTRAT